MHTICAHHYGATWANCAICWKTLPTHAREKWREEVGKWESRRQNLFLSPTHASLRRGREGIGREREVDEERFTSPRDGSSFSSRERRDREREIKRESFTLSSLFFNII